MDPGRGPHRGRDKTHRSGERPRLSLLFLWELLFLFSVFVESVAEPLVRLIQSVGVERPGKRFSGSDLTWLRQHLL